VHSNIRLVNPPGFVGRLKMTAQPLIQFGAVTLNPTPDGRVIRFQTALGEQLFDITQRKLIAKIPAHGTQNQLRRRLPPLEDCRSGCVLHDRFRLPAIPAKLATHPAKAVCTRFVRTRPRDARLGYAALRPPSGAPCEHRSTVYEDYFQLSSRPTCLSNAPHRRDRSHVVVEVSCCPFAAFWQMLQLLNHHSVRHVA